MCVCVYVCFWFNVRVYKFVQFRLLLFLLFCYFGWTKSMSKNQCICVCIVMTIWCNSFYHTHRNQMRIWIDFVWIHMVFIHNSCVQRLFNVEFKMNRNGWKRIWKKQMKIEIELYTIDVHRMFMNSLTIYSANFLSKKIGGKWPFFSRRIQKFFNDLNTIFKRIFQFLFSERTNEKNHYPNYFNRQKSFYTNVVWEIKKKRKSMIYVSFLINQVHISPKKRKLFKL
mgnify:CR=1 FL=1